MRVPTIVIILHIHAVIGSLDSCIHGGNKYDDGDYFRPNGTIMKTESPEQCVQCRCHKGLVICEIEKCPVLQCETPIQQPEYCCQKCPGVAESSNGSSDFVLRKMDGRKTKKTGCTSNGKFYADGSVWQPVIGPLGVMSCVECKCEKTVIVCKRYRCKELPCSHPQKEFGKCCGVCPTPDGMSKELRAKCLPKWSELFVFKTPDIGETSSQIEYAFLEGQTKGETVHSHVWNARERMGDALTIRNISQRELLTHNLQLLGATSYRRWRKYNKREEKLRFRCLIHCQRKILQLENILRVYLVNLRSKCNEDEIDTSNLWKFSSER